MSDCFRCGVSGEKVRLHDAISNKGIVKVCGDCANLENIPVIKKPTETQLAEAQKPRTRQERLAARAPPKLMKTEVTLRDLIDEKFKNRGVQSNPDLIENFHWKIQQAKRMKRITREEFAKGIGESDATVRRIEQGFLPANDYKIVNKIESFLGISLRKDGASGFPDTSKKYSFDSSMEKVPEKKLAFDSESTKDLKIGDLKEMEKEKPRGIFSWFKKKEEKKSETDSSEHWEEEYPQDDERFLDEEFEKGE